jgi:hypothetical protein
VTSSALENIVDRACFRISAMTCCEWSAHVRWRLGQVTHPVRNPILRWLPSQNGLLADAPHRHSATRVSCLTSVWS